MLYTIKKCKDCGKRTKKLYYHANSKNKKKWIPILYYCFNCRKFRGNVEDREKLKYKKNPNNDFRFKGKKHNDCRIKMIKLYQLKRINDRLKWLPVFWYCIYCETVVTSIKINEK